MKHPAWVLERVLDFLNSARTADQILAAPELQDDPSTGKGYAIGEKVAQKILEHKNTLPRRRYQSASDVLAVPGLGEDKLNDLLHSFSTSADEAFKAALFNGIIMDNWELNPVVVAYESSADFAAAISGMDQLRRIVGKALLEARSYGTANEKKLERIRLRQAYLSTIEDGHLASFQFAWWWYRFDYDNWFSFETMRLACENYLGYHGHGDQGMRFASLQLYNESPLNETRRSEFIPIVINLAEQKITVWTAELND